MENEIKVGDWIRTKAGKIHKVTRIVNYYENDKLVYDRQGIYWDNKHSGYEIWQLEDIIVKHSPNLINLIQCGDYVNGHLVIDIPGDESGAVYLEQVTKGALIPTLKEDIQTIVTKEMIKSISYKVTKM